ARRLARLARARRRRYMGSVSLARASVELVQRQVAVEQWRQALVMADEQQAGAGGSAFGKQQFEEGLAGVGVQRRGRFVGDHQLRLADQRAGGGDALLLADRQLVGAPGVQVGAEAEVLEQGGGRRGHATMTLARACGAQGREAAGQLDVVAYAEKRQQVELL